MKDSKIYNKYTSVTHKMVMDKSIPHPDGCVCIVVHVLLCVSLRDWVYVAASVCMCECLFTFVWGFLLHVIACVLPRKWADAVCVCACSAEWLCMCLQSVWEMEGFGFGSSMLVVGRGGGVRVGIVGEISVHSPWQTSIIKNLLRMLIYRT